MAGVAAAAPAAVVARSRRRWSGARRWLLWLPVRWAPASRPTSPCPASRRAWSAARGRRSALRALLACRRRSGARAVTGSEALLLGLAALALGFALAQLRLQAVAAPILDRAGVYAVEGRVVDLAPLPAGDRCCSTA